MTTAIPSNVLSANRHNRDFAQCVERARILISSGMTPNDAAVQALHERGVEPVVDLLRVVKEMVQSGE